MMIPLRQRVLAVISAFGILIIQASFLLGDPLQGVFLLIILIPVAIMQRYSLEKSDVWGRMDRSLILTMFIATLCIRLYRIEDFHNIGELSARFGYAVNQILEGHYIFPCLEKYEYDENLTAFIIAPFIHWFGRSWTDFKMVSAGLGSLIVPMSYLLVFRIAGRSSAVLAAGMLCLSGYMQRCDALISMLRFNLIGLLVVANLYFLIRFYESHGKWRWALPAGFASGIAWYFHSMGRLVPVMMVLSMILILIRFPRGSRWKAATGVFMAVALVLLLSTPMTVYIKTTGGYLYYKKRQILGFHESFPFSWHALKANVYITLTNFNYLARLQTHFPADKPLLRYFTAAGVIGGLCLLWRTRRNINMNMLTIGIIMCIAPLCIVTPGAWRGVYFTPGVVLLTILSAIWWGDLFRVMTAWNSRKTLLISLLFLMGLTIIRVPGFYRGKYAPPRANNQITRLFADLETAPKVPHYFSSDLDQCIPGNAIYEFTKGAYFSEKAVFKKKPLRLLNDNVSEIEMSPGSLGDGPFVCVLAPSSEEDIANELFKIFPEATKYRMLQSGVLTLFINFPAEKLTDQD